MKGEIVADKKKLKEITETVHDTKTATSLSFFIFSTLIGT